MGAFYFQHLPAQPDPGLTGRQAVGTSANAAGGKLHAFLFLMNLKWPQKLTLLPKQAQTHQTTADP